MNKKIVVTGGAGFIGPHVVRGLLEKGYEVAVVDNLSGGKRESVPEGATFHEVGVEDTQALIKIFEGVDVVFHLAAVPRVPYSIEHPLESNEANVTGTLSVLTAANTAKVRRVVFSSSSSVYGNQEAMPVVETMDVQPISPYAVQKYVGEVYAKLFSEIYNLETVSLRYFNIYGSGMDPEGAYALVIGKFLKQKMDGTALTITGDGEQTRDFTHVSDLVNANILAAFSDTVGKGEVINIGRGVNVSVNRIAELVGGPVEYIAPRIEPKHTRAGIERAKQLLGWEPTISIEEGIEMLKKELNLA